MIEARPDDIVFNLSAFKRRARALLKQSGESPVTLSKRLFNGHAHALPRIVADNVPDAEKTFPRLDTLLRADKTLSDLEAAPAEAER